MKPTKGNVIVRLPKEQTDRERKVGSIFVQALEGGFHNDFTFGEVIAVGDNCTNVEVGDIAYFSQMSIQQALQNAGRDVTRNETIKDNPNNIPVYYIEDKDGGDCISFPSQKVSIECSDISGTHFNTIFMSIICVVRNGEVICLNDFYLFTKAYDDGQLIDGIKARKTESGLFLPMMKEVDEKEKVFKCLYSPVDGVIKSGDKFVSMKHCDIPLEGVHNNPVFPPDTFYIEGHNILATVEDIISMGIKHQLDISITEPNWPIPQKPLEVRPSE